MTLFSADDLEKRLGRVLTSEEVARSDALIDDVSGSIVLASGQTFVQDDYELRARVKRGKVRLPQKPVNSVDAVTDRFDNALTYTFDGIDTVFVDCCQFTGQPPLQVVDITYNAGPATVPSEIVGVACSIALRTLGVDPTEGSVVSESIDGYSYRIGSAGGAGSYGLLPAEAKILRAYKGRRAIGSIALAQ